MRFGYPRNPRRFPAPRPSRRRPDRPGGSSSARPLWNVAEGLGLLAQEEFLHLAGRRLGEIGDDLHMLGPILFGDLVLSQIGLHCFQIEAMSRPRRDEGA